MFGVNAMKELGSMLRAAREAKGLSLEDIQEETKIREDYLRAIEEGEFGDRQAEVYMKGFLINFARSVGLDEAEILEVYYRIKAEKERKRRNEEEEREKWQTKKPSRSKVFLSELPIWIGPLIIIILSVGLYSMWRFWQTPPTPPTDYRVNKTPLEEGSPERIEIGITEENRDQALDVSTETDSTQAARREKEASILIAKARNSVWIGLYEQDSGKMVFEGTLGSGEKLEWKISTGITVRIGNAAGVALFFEGQDLGRLGGEGEVVTIRLAPSDG